MNGAHTQSHGLVIGPRQGEPVSIIAEDGVELAAEVVAGPAAAPTMILCHGYMLDRTSWRFQQDALAEVSRLVLWDQRGHGRSGWGAADRATMRQLGRDLSAVLEATAPSGPVVLVGHSMGAAAILAMADWRPEIFGSRVVGVALLGTPTNGNPADGFLGLPRPGAQAAHFLISTALPQLARLAKVVDPIRRHTGTLSYLLTRPYLYRSRVPRPVARATIRALASTPVNVVAAFYPDLVGQDTPPGLAALSRCPTLIVAGADDHLAPPRHCQVMADAVASAELVVLPHTSHLMITERPEQVNTLLRRFLTRCPNPV